MKRLILIAGMFAILCSGSLFAGGASLQKLVGDTQKLDQGDGTMRLIWWLPTEYWKMSFSGSSTLTPQQKQYFFDAVDKYIVVVVVDAQFSPFGVITSTPKKDLMDLLSITIGPDTHLKPLAEAEITSETKNLFAMMKPALSSMLGKVGQGMEFICFPGVNADGQHYLDPKKEGSFTVNLGQSSYHWRLPLGSLLPPKYDPQTGETFPGNYLYNPFTGASLQLKPEEKK